MTETKILVVLFPKEPGGSNPKRFGYWELRF